ncbi:MAG: hypothetical protein WCJ30_00180 [Deltaproteobacteria bacterium]
MALTTATEAVRRSRTVALWAWLGSPLARQLAGIFVLWATYVWITDVVATAVMHDGGHVLTANWAAALNNWVADIHTAPPLARWDSVWYYSIATEGYPARTGLGIYNAGFMPLLGLLMRWGAALFHVSPYVAGTWVSRLALLAGMYAFFFYVRADNDASPGADRPRIEPLAPLLAMLFFPTAYILVSVYAESLFFAFCVSTFLLAKKRHYALAAATAFLAGLSRAHVIALVPALGVLALEHWRGATWSRRARAFLPMLGAVAALAAVAWHFKNVSGDPLLYVHRKTYFGTTNAGPAGAWRSTIWSINDARMRGHFGSIYTLLELPSAILLAASGLILAWTKRFSEAVFVLGSLGLSVMAGSLWGLPRYTIFLFPVFMLIGRIHRRTALWNAYVLCGVLVQACMMVNYVLLRAPAP